MDKRSLGRAGLEENIGSAGLELTAEDLADLDRASREVKIVGERYTAEMTRLVNR